jgi:hypothetical protein
LGKSGFDLQARRFPLIPLCEHLFVTSQGSLHGQFQRSVERGNVLQAVATARELGRLSLSDSFALLLLFADKDLTRFDRAAPRWHARLITETGDLTIAEAHATLGALALVPTDARPQALELLRAVCQAHGMRL